MLTTRHVSHAGFGLKNTDWNKKQLLIEWREAWANINNDMLKRKGLAERIDHRSYQEQGVDRLPYIHLGHEAAALEKKGIHTKKGDYNREIKRINNERTANINPPAEGASSGARNQKSEPAPINAAKNTRAALMEANCKLWQLTNEIKKNLQNPEQIQPLYNEILYDAQKIDQEMRDHNTPCPLDKERTMLERQNSERYKNIAKLDNREESIDEGIRNINTVQFRIAELKLERKKRRFWEIKRKRELDRQIKQAEEKLRTAQSYFWLENNITPEEAPQELKQIQNQRNHERKAIENNNIRITEITQTLDAIALKYHTKKQLDDARADKDPIQEKLGIIKTNAIIIENAILDIIEERDRTPIRTKNRNIPIYR